jgi:hypothetical protein
MEMESYDHKFGQRIRVVQTNILHDAKTTQ